MKKTNTNKGLKKLIPAAGMLMLSAAMLGTSTFAWFTMNKEVTLTGMEVKATVSDSLLIANSTKGTAHAGEDTFSNGTNFAITGILQPVSTVSAANNSYFYTYDAKADGSKATSTAQIAYNAVPSTGDNAYKVSTDGTNYTYNAFVDYVVELKAINADSANAKEIRLTDLNLLYDGVVLQDHAYRIAIFEQDNTGTATSPAYTAIADDAAANNIFAYTGFDYFGTDNTAEGVASATARGAINPVVNNSGWTKAVDAGAVDYTKLTIRLWLEGEDTDCYSSKFQNLTKEWTLDLKFELANGSTDTTTGAAVAIINSGVKATATAAGAASLSSPHNNAQAVSYQWYKDNHGALPDTEVSGQATGTYSGAAGDVYCVITTERGTKYRTNTITVS
jgi:hypothetical protein